MITILELHKLNICSVDLVFRKNESILKVIDESILHQVKVVENSDTKCYSELQKTFAIRN